MTAGGETILAQFAGCIVTQLLARRTQWFQGSCEQGDPRNTWVLPALGS